MNVTVTLDLSNRFIQAIADLIQAANPKPPLPPSIMREQREPTPPVAATAARPLEREANSSRPALPTGRWSDERKALLRTEYAASSDLRGLHQRLNALPGDNIPYENMRWWANSNGLAQPARRAGGSRLPTTGARQAALEAATVVSAVSEPIVQVEPVAEVEIPSGAAAEPVRKIEPEALRWTDERLEVLDFYYAAGDALPDILARVNAFPGPVVSNDQLRATIVSRRLKRAAPTEASVPGGRQIEPATETDDVTIRHWAGARGLCNSTEPLDMTRINRKRVELGLAPFVRQGALRASKIGGAA